MAIRTQRGFASMDPEQRRRMSREGGRASQRSRGGRQYEDEDYDDENYQEDDYENPQNRYDDDEDYDQYGPGDEYDEKGDYNRRGEYGEGDDYDDEDYGDENDDEDYDEGRGQSRNMGGGGFASMPREEVRRIASMGGRASGRGKGNGRLEGSRSRRKDEFDGRRMRSFDNGRRYGDERGRSSSSGRRGFADMPREEVTRIARTGGEASHGGRRGGNVGRSGSSGRGGNDSRGGSSGRRRGFGAMSREEVRRIARKEAELAVSIVRCCKSGRKQ